MTTNLAAVIETLGSKDATLVGQGDNQVVLKGSGEQGCLTCRTGQRSEPQQG